MRLRIFFVLALAAGVWPVAAAGQTEKLPPIEPPKPMPSEQGPAPTIVTTTTEVLVPTLVERHGQVIYGLNKPSDFILEDDGVPQKIRVQAEMDTAPVSLVVAVELGGASVLEFGKLAHLGPLLDLFLTDPRSEAALIGFDSQPYLLCDYTHSENKLNHALENLQPGDGGDAILDTVSYAVNLLDDRPKEYRRVLLLISEERDHGSKHAKPVEVIREIGQSAVLVISVTFSPAEAEIAHDTMDSGEDRTMNLASALFMVVQAFKKNMAKEIATMSGGEYMTFSGDRKFEQRVVDAARDARNRYLITFSPSNPTPGLHTIKVRTAQDYGAKVVARADYWLGP